MDSTSPRTRRHRVLTACASETGAEAGHPPAPSCPAARLRRDAGRDLSPESPMDLRRDDTPVRRRDRARFHTAHQRPRTRRAPSHRAALPSGGTSGRVWVSNRNRQPASVTLPAPAAAHPAPALQKNQADNEGCSRVGRVRSVGRGRERRLSVTAVAQWCARETVWLRGLVQYTCLSNEDPREFGLSNEPGNETRN